MVQEKPFRPHMSRRSNMKIENQKEDLQNKAIGQ